MTHRSLGSLDKAPPFGNPEDQDEQETYRLDASSHELVTRYEPRFKGMGALQLVYDVSDHPNVVAKVDTNTVKRFLENPSYSHAKVQKYLEKERIRQARLKESFGSHVLSIRHFFMRVPITPSIILSLFDDGEVPKGSLGTNEVPAIVSIQQKSREIEDNTFISLLSFSLENGSLNTNKYERTMRALLSSEYEGSLDAYLFEAPPDLREIFLHIKTDPQFAETMRDFVKRKIKYVGITGDILDLKGIGNVAFFQEENKWNYHLVDALYPQQKKRKQGLHAHINTLITSKEERLYDRDDEFDIKMTVNFMCLINALAIELGIKERLSFQRGVSATDKVVEYLAEQYNKPKE